MNWDLIVYYRYMSTELVFRTLVNIAASLYLGEKKRIRAISLHSEYMKAF